MARGIGKRYIPIIEECGEIDLCPFCDSDATLCRQVKVTSYSPENYVAHDFFWVRCPCCKSKTRDFETREDAIRVWNFRKYTERRVEEEVAKAKHAWGENKPARQDKTRKGRKKKAHYRK